MDQTHNEAITVKTIRDAKTAFRVNPSAQYNAELRGIVVSRNKTKATTFLMLNDGTDSIQVIVPNELFTAANTAVAESARIRVDGIVTEFENKRTGLATLSIMSAKAPAILPDLSNNSGDLIADFEEVGIHVLLARIKDSARGYFSSERFTEIEPRYLSLHWEETAIKPLLVNYIGFGAPIYLVPSPKAQLLRAVATTNLPRVFTISRYFSMNYRDGISGQDSTIVTAAGLDMNITEATSISEAAIRRICGGIETLPEDQGLLAESPTTEHLKVMPADPARVSVPTMQIIGPDVSSDDSSTLTLFRLLWPSGNGATLAVADGSCEVYPSGVIISYISVHIERILVVLNRNASLRRNRSIDQRGPLLTDRSKEKR